MEIVKNVKKNVDFDDVDQGECFEHGGMILIKTDCDQDAVDLATGEVYGALCGEEVTLVKAKLIIDE